MAVEISREEELAGELIYALVRMDADSVRSVLQRGLISASMRDVDFPVVWSWIRRSPERAGLVHDAVLMSSERRMHGDRTDILQMLIDYGCPWDKKTADGYTPLHNAALVNHAPAARLLIALGADINAQSVKGYTPLQAAINYQSSAVAAMLLEAGAKTQLKNHHGEDALDYAKRVNADDVDMLLSAETRRRVNSSLAALAAIDRAEKTEENADYLEQVEGARVSKAANADVMTPWRAPRPRMG